MPTTQQGKAGALETLKRRREENTGKDWRAYTRSLPAGSEMYYGCQSCNTVADVKPENWYVSLPKRLCDECQALKDCGWLE